MLWNMQSHIMINLEMDSPKTEPWILDDFDNRKECIKKANELIRSGYKNVTVLNYDESVLECIDWDYVKQHQN